MCITFILDMYSTFLSTLQPEAVKSLFKYMHSNRPCAHCIFKQWQPHLNKDEEFSHLVSAILTKLIDVLCFDYAREAALESAVLQCCHVSYLQVLLGMLFGPSSQRQSLHGFNEVVCCRYEIYYIFFGVNKTVSICSCLPLPYFSELCVYRMRLRSKRWTDNRI